MSGGALCGGRLPCGRRRDGGAITDWYAFVVAFKGVLLEGLEVAFPLRPVDSGGIGTPGRLSFSDIIAG